MQNMLISQTYGRRSMANQTELIDPFDSEYKTANEPSYSGVDSGLIDPYDDPAPQPEEQAQPMPQTEGQGNNITNKNRS